MPTATTRFALLKPTDPDPFVTEDIAANWQALADAAAGYLVGPAADRPAPTAEIEGYFHWAEDTGDLSYCDGTEWHLIGEPAGAVQMFAGAAAPTGYLLCDGQEVDRTTYARLFAVIGTTFGAGDGSTTFNVPDFRGRMGIGVGTLGSDTYTRGDTGGEARHVLSQSEIPSHNHTGSVANDTHDHGAGFHNLGSHRHSDGSLSTNNSGNHGHSFTAQLTAASSHTHEGGAGSIAQAHTGGGNTGAGAIRGDGNHNHDVQGQTAYTGLGNHSHTIDDDTHNHAVTINATGGGGAHENRPPFLGLHFIIKT